MLLWDITVGLLDRPNRPEKVAMILSSGKEVVVLLQIEESGR